MDPDILEHWSEEAGEFFDALESDFDRLEDVIERADELWRQVPAGLKQLRKRLRSVSVEYAEALRRVHIGEAPMPASKPAVAPKPKPKPSELSTRPLAMPSESSEPGSIFVLDSKGGEPYIAVRENFVVTLFARRRLNQALAEASSALLGTWLDLIGEDNLRFACIGGSSSSDKDMSPAVLSRARKRFVRDAKSGARHYMRLYGPQSSCPDFSFVSNINDPEDCQMAWGRYFTTNLVELYFPVSFFDAHGAGAIVQIVAKLAALLPYDSGVAGWALHDRDHHFSSTSRAQERVGQLAQTYPGYFLSDGGSYSAHTMGDRACGAQWLTLVGPKLLEELGGRSTAEALGPEIVVHKCGRGVLVQAGPEPVVGRNDEGLTAYRKVAQWLRPVTTFNPQGAQRYMDSAEAWTTRYL